MITFDTVNSVALLAAYKRAIDQGHVDTWSYDSDGDFTHTPAQWNKKAYLRPVTSQGKLTLKFMAHKTDATWAVYGVYHGRFIESMITHCNQLFSTGAATAKPSSSDTIAA